MTKQQTEALPDGMVPWAIEAWRRREVQMIGAAISTRDWHGVENAYNRLRDKIDAALSLPAREVSGERAADYGPECNCGQVVGTHITAHYSHCAWREWAELNGAICQPGSTWKYTRPALATTPALREKLEADLVEVVKRLSALSTAAYEYAGNYLLDERDSPELCRGYPNQHERIVALFEQIEEADATLAKLDRSA